MVITYRSSYKAIISNPGKAFSYVISKSMLQVDIILADLEGNCKDLERSSQLVKQLQLNYQEKNVAMSKLREIHDRRLERMSDLEEHLRLLCTLLCTLLCIL